MGDRSGEPRLYSADFLRSNMRGVTRYNSLGSAPSVLLCQGHGSSWRRAILRDDESEPRGNPEDAFTVKATVCAQNAQVGIEPQKIAKGLNSNHGVGHGIFFRHQLLQKHLQSLPGATAQLRKQCAIIEKIKSENLWDAGDDEAPMSQGEFNRHPRYLQ
jgi:hypothetical protein